MRPLLDDARVPVAVRLAKNFDYKKHFWPPKKTSINKWRLKGNILYVKIGTAILNAKQLR
jgi:hypothetical protein